MEQELSKLLRAYKKTFDDVLYVAYATYDVTLKTQNEYHCSIQDYLKAISNTPSIFEVTNIYDIVIVGNDWWVDYGYRGEPYIHLVPSKPDEYKAMSLN